MSVEINNPDYWFKATVSVEDVTAGFAVYGRSKEDALEHVEAYRTDPANRLLKLQPSEESPEPHIESAAAEDVGRFALFKTLSPVDSRTAVWLLEYRHPPRPVDPPPPLFET